MEIYYEIPMAGAWGSLSEGARLDWERLDVAENGGAARLWGWGRGCLFTYVCVYGDIYILIYVSGVIIYMFTMLVYLFVFPQVRFCLYLM